MKLLTIVLFTFVFACKQKSNVSDVSDSNLKDKQTLTIDTFSTFPPEIVGCSCIYSNDSLEFEAGRFIYVNDYAKISFLKINGVLTKFTQTEVKDIDPLNQIAKFKSDNYEVNINTKIGKRVGDESRLMTGTIKVSDKTGKAVEKKFYGVCGC